MDAPRHAQEPAASGAAPLLAGALLGAGLAALVQFVVPLGAWQPLAALLSAGLLLAGGVALERRGRGHVAGAFSAATLALCGSLPFFAFAAPILAALALAFVVLVALLHGARSPLALGAVVALFTSARHATQVDIAQGRDLVACLAFLGVLVAYGALLVAQPRGTWRSAALAAHALGIVLAAFPALDAMGVTDPGVAALALCGLLATLLAVGLALRERALAVGAGALLALAALAFAFLVWDAPIAAVALLLAGAIALWNVEGVRRFLARVRTSS